MVVVVRGEGEEKVERGVIRGQLGGGGGACTEGGLNPEYVIKALFTMITD